MSERLPEKIGKVTLNYDFYPGEDIYSDGAIEDELLAITRDASKVEYPGIIEEKKSWPILYHLSSLRGNIVDWLPITKQDKVLEIGSGCGAITDTLSSKAGHVTCVDLSARRSLINAYRNQDQDNIEIRVGNFSDIEPSLETDYDYACLIGVFEYGKLYIHTNTPFEDFLQIIQKHVKNNGRIVIAIENKFGLKYWAGCKEDHNGEYYSGLEGYPEQQGAVTFTKEGLQKIFSHCQIDHYSFYYPYPDYKFPTVIYSDDRLPKLGELTDNLRNFDRDRMLNFNEKHVFDSTIEDHYFDIFSNSFCVIIGGKPETVYSKYSNDRMRKYALRTDIIDDGKEKRVRKVPLTEEAAAHIKQLDVYCELLKQRYEGSGLRINPCTYHEEGYAEFPFEKGITLMEKMDDCLHRNDQDAFEALFRRYYEFISYNPRHIAVTDYDLIFANILVDGDTWSLIDYEWTIEEDIEPQRIAFRAVYCYLLEEENRNRLDLDRIMRILGVSEQEAEEYRSQEQDFQKKVTGRHKSMGEIRAMLGTYCVDPEKLMEQHLKQILDRRIQVYFNRGNGFSEEDSRYIPDVYVSDQDVEVSIVFDGNVQELRIDPADHACMVKIRELVLNEKEIQYFKNFIRINGKMLRPGVCVFATEDPNLVFNLSDLPLKGENQIDLKLEVISLSSELANELEATVKSSISDLLKINLMK